MQVDAYCGALGVGVYLPGLRFAACGLRLAACGGMESRTTFRRKRRLCRQCAGCKHQCSVTGGTVFGSAKLPLARWFLAMQFLTQDKSNVAVLELKRQIGVCCRAGWLVKHKPLEAVRLVDANRQLTSRIEVDDACIGEQRSGGKTGRGSDNEAQFVAAVQAAKDGRPQVACLSPRPFTRQTPADFFACSTVLLLTAVSDDPGCFEVAVSLGACHDRIVTGCGRASVEPEQFRCVGTLIGDFEKVLSGDDHWVRFANYAHRHLSKVQFRFNRRFDRHTILGSLVRELVAAPPSPGRGVQIAEHRR